MKLWSKENTATTNAVEQFTVGKDKDFDALLAPFDVLGSIAHVTMLSQIGLLTSDEKNLLVKALQKIYVQVSEPGFSIPDGVEDIHSYVEFILTQQLGDLGKKIHSARSRNDQVLVDIKLFLRSEIKSIVEQTQSLFHLLQTQSEQFKNHLLPGYTHLQLAMPSSFGLWFVVYAQMGRGKTERIVSAALANIVDTLARMSMDACLYLNQNFGFISFPADLTTGSSIMPHKKNPDVFELTRSYCNRLKALPNEIALMTTNLPSGYQRDLQLLKEHLFPAFNELRNCLQMMELMLSNISVKEHIADAEQYQFMFSVEEVNKLVLQGVPFRDAYQQVGNAIEKGQFTYSTQLSHTHEGSIGNLCNAEIGQMMDTVLKRFQFSKAKTAINALL